LTTLTQSIFLVISIYTADFEIMPRIEYVFLDTNGSTGLPLLIELSSRANTTISDLTFCQEKIIRPRLEMYNILKILKLPSIFKDLERDAILKHNNTLCSYRILCTYPFYFSCRFSPSPFY